MLFVFYRVKVLSKVLRSQKITYLPPPKPENPVAIVMLEEIDKIEKNAINTC